MPNKNSQSEDKIPNKNSQLENKIKEAIGWYAFHPLGREAFPFLNNALEEFTELLKINHTLGGSYYYDYVEKRLNEAKDYSKKFVNQDGDANPEELYILLSDLSRQAQRYLDYKEEDPDDLSKTTTEKDRMDAVTFLRDYIRKSADALGEAIGKERLDELAGEPDAKGKRNPGSDQVTAQREMLEELQASLNETRGIVHGESPDFRAMMDGLTSTIEIIRRLETNPDDHEMLWKYQSAVEDLQKNTGSYLSYKKDHNDFGHISEKRIHNADRLELALKNIMPAIEAKEEQLAVSWYDSMVGKLKDNGIDVKDPFATSRVVILDPQNNVSDQDVNDASSKSFTEDGYEAKLKVLDKLAHSRHMAFAPIGEDSKTVNPLKETDDPAEWIKKEMPENVENISSKQKLHLYRMARENRLFILDPYTELTFDGFSCQQIKIGADNLCSTEKNPNMDEDKYKEIKQSLACNNPFGYTCHLLGEMKSDLKKDTQLKSDDRDKLMARHKNILSYENLIQIHNYFPEWFRDSDDIKTLGRLASCNDPLHGHPFPDEEIEWRDSHFQVSPDNMEIMKDVLKAAEVSSFEELRDKNLVLDEQGNPYKEKTPFRLAEKMFLDMNKGHKIIIGEKKYGISFGSFKEAVVYGKDEKPEEYLEALSRWTKAVEKEINIENIDRKSKDCHDKLRKWYEKNFPKGADDRYGIGFQYFGLNTCVWDMERVIDRRNDPVENVEKTEAMKHLTEDAFNTVGMTSLRVLAAIANAPRLTEQYFRVARLMNQYRDLEYEFKHGVTNPLKPDTDTARRLAARLVDLRAEDIIRKLQPTMEMNGKVGKASQPLSDEQQAALEAAKTVLFHINIKGKQGARDKAIVQCTESEFIQNLIKDGTGKEILEGHDDHRLMDLYKKYIDARKKKNMDGAKEEAKAKEEVQAKEEAKAKEEVQAKENAKAKKTNLEKTNLVRK